MKSDVEAIEGAGKVQKVKMRYVIAYRQLGLLQHANVR